MPDLPFVAKGITDVLTGQEKMRIGAQALKDLYKQQNLEMAGAASAARSAVAGTLTEMEKVEKKIAAVRLGLSKGVIDPVKGEEAIKRLQKRLDEMKKSAAEAEKGLARAFGNEIISRAVQFAGPAGVIAGAMSAITAEMRAQMAIIDKSASLKMGVSASRNVMLRNLPDMDEATKVAILKENQALASEVGVSETVINAARADAYAASGGNRKASLEAVRGAAKYLFDRPSEIAGYAGALLDLSNVTGTDRWDVNLGLLEQVGGISRVTDPGRQAMNIPSALIGARKFGMTTAEAAGAYGMITTMSGDLTGASGGTAVIQLARELRDFREELLTEKQANMLTGSTRKRLLEIQDLPAGQKIIELQGDAELAKVFIRGVEGEAKFRAQIENLTMNANSEEAKRFAAFRDQIGSLEDMAEGGRGAVAGLGVNPLNRQSRFEQGLGSTAEQLALLDPTPNLTRAARESLQDVLMLAGESNLGAASRTGISRFGDNSIGLSVDEAAGLVETIAKDLEDGVEAMTTATGGIGSYGATYRETPAREATAGELETAKLLRALIEEVKAGTEATKKNKPAPNSIPTR